MNRRQLADRLCDERSRAGLTQTQLADAVGVGQPQVNKWEKGVNLPSVSRVPILAAALGLKPEVVYRWIAEATGDELAEVRKENTDLKAMVATAVVEFRAMTEEMRELAGEVRKALP